MIVGRVIICSPDSITSSTTTKESLPGFGGTKVVCHQAVILTETAFAVVNVNIRFAGS
jgi:hypothetical protein